MRRRRFSTTSLCLLLVGLPMHLAGQETGGGTGAAFLLVPVGARATALGQAAVADGGTSEAAFWNPAGLATLPHSEFAVHYASTFASNNTALTGYLADDRLGVVGVAAYLVDFGSQDVTPPGGGPPVGRLSPRGIQLLASYATDVAGSLGLGVSYKLIQFRQDCQGNCGSARTVVGTTHAIDVGLQYAFGAARDLTAGLAVRHAGFRLQLENREQADPLPTRVQLGMAYRVFLPTTLPDGERLDLRFLLDLQEAWGEYGNPDALLGLEFGYRDLVRLRTGYALVESGGRGPSVGLGVRFDRIAIDFARVFFETSTLDEPAYLSVRFAL